MPKCVMAWPALRICSMRRGLAGIGGQQPSLHKPSSIKLDLSLEITHTSPLESLRLSYSYTILRQEMY